MKNQSLEAVDRQTLAREMITYRLRSGLTQKEIAAKFGVSRYSILRCETQRYLGMATLYRLSSQLARAIREESMEIL